MTTLLHEESTSPAEDEATTPTPILVKWDENEPANPFNWSTKYRAFITLQLGMIAMAASVGSSIMAPTEPTLQKVFHIGHEVSVLCISLYILGFAFGPLCWAPISELWGRRVSLIFPMMAVGLFSIGAATSQNIQSVLITRYFAGLFASSPVSNVGAIMGDIWPPKVRGTAVVFYALAVVGGPTLGPVIGASLTVNPHLGWRWTEYIQAIWTFTVTTIILIFLPETYAPVLLKRKAERLRKETGNQAYYHPHEMTKLSPKIIVTKHLSRPLRMLFTEPMVTCIALYASFVYGLLYMTLEVFPIIFAQHRGWGLVTSSLPFLALLTGVGCAMLVNLANQPRYARLVDAAGGKPVPEARCAPMAVGGIVFAIGLFWFGWTANPKIHWVVPVLAAVFIGAGFNIIFQQCINFLVDTYRLYAASATSANTLLRSALAASFPLAATPMFNNLGVGPAMSLLGGIAVIAIPVPFLFMKYGLTLRKMSKFAPVDDERPQANKETRA
ncbi:major facilitator superfamily domain-containing protein [Trichoderma sp. SZMC 28011]|uniref:MFS permease n=1 Tax=Trichoderma guizhouense TaxID=1491466 RepID=A0A1T3CHG5_9HYPO|nr:MFS permease [Trichoderma guizhouense]